MAMKQETEVKEVKKNNKAIKVTNFKAYPITLSVFFRDKEERMYSFQIKKTYKTKEGDYKDTQNFDRSDLPTIALLLQNAYESLEMTAISRDIESK